MQLVDELLNELCEKEDGPGSTIWLGKTFFSLLNSVLISPAPCWTLIKSGYKRDHLFSEAMRIVACSFVILLLFFSFCVGLSLEPTCGMTCTVFISCVCYDFNSIPTNLFPAFELSHSHWCMSSLSPSPSLLNSFFCTKLVELKSFIGKRMLIIFERWKENQLSLRAFHWLTDESTLWLKQKKNITKNKT